MANTASRLMGQCNEEEEAGRPTQTAIVKIEEN